jgi:hypothetical protein
VPRWRNTQLLLRKCTSTSPVGRSG